MAVIYVTKLLLGYVELTHVLWGPVHLDWTRRQII